jgi:hypothetical protein
VGDGTTDPLEQVLQAGYFAASGLVQPGELIYVRMQARAPGYLASQRNHRGRAEPEPVHMALLMTAGMERNGAVRARLVQDFGRTDAARRSRRRSGCPWAALGRRRPSAHAAARPAAVPARRAATPPGAWPRTAAARSASW